MGSKNNLPTRATRRRLAELGQPDTGLLFMLVSLSTSVATTTGLSRPLIASPLFPVLVHTVDHYRSVLLPTTCLVVALPLVNTESGDRETRCTTAFAENVGKRDFLFNPYCRPTLEQYTQNITKAYSLLLLIQSIDAVD